MRRKTEAKRLQIMEGAARVFEQRGYQGTTLNDIAREVGCSKVTIYNYFDSREDLLKAIIVEGSRPTLEFLQAQLAGEDALIDRLRTFARTYLILIMNDYSLATTRLMMAENANYNFASMFAEGGEQDIWFHVRTAITTGANDQASVTDAGELIAALRALLHGGSHYQCLIGVQAPPEAQALIVEADKAIDIIAPRLRE